MVWPNAGGAASSRAPVSWRMLGIPIHVDASWALVVVFIAWSLAHRYFPLAAPGFAPTVYWLLGGLSALLLFTCVLLHELSHALTARRYGIPVDRVTLFFFGGVAQISRGPARAWVEFVIAAAGPIVSAVLAAGCALASRAIPIRHPVDVALVAVVRYLALINTALLCFNLLPGFPLDGGRILRALLWARTRDLRRATRIASLSGAALAVALIGLGVVVVIRGSWVGGAWYLLLGTYLRDAALSTYRATARTAEG